MTMHTQTLPPAAIAQPTPQSLVLSGTWTAAGLQAGMLPQLDALQPAAGDAFQVDAAQVAALDSAGAWVLQKLLLRLRSQGGAVDLQGLGAPFSRLLDFVAQQVADQARKPLPPPAPQPGVLESVGRSTVEAAEQAVALLGFIGETAVVLARCAVQPRRFRWRSVLVNIRIAGFDALPIVGLLAFLLGIVVAYQSADQLRQYGANIFIVDIVGLSMLREFAPLIAAIIVAGRSGSAYAAQIGTMVVTEEVDALRTLGIAPVELLVLPKLIALVVALPLLTVFADVLSVLGGMVMARAQLDVGFAEFLDRFVKAVSATSYMVGVGKAPVFAAIIAVVGCFQGFRTRGGAESVGRQTTRSVVQSIFLVIVADALFSIIFSVLDL